MSKNKDKRIEKPDWDSILESRKRYNEGLIWSMEMHLINLKHADVQETVRKKLDEHPELRFGQVICNDICPDYRDETPCDKTRFIMELLFDGCKCDPFYEEPHETVKRLHEKDKDIKEQMINNLP